MNRLKSLPWTQILLFLLLVAMVLNYLELREIKDAIDSVDLEILRLKITLLQR
jgi:hypothetical protein